MSAERDDRDDAAFAHLTGAHWSADAGGDCHRCRELFGGTESRQQEIAGSEPAPGNRVGRWLRVVMLLVAVLTVTTAVVRAPV